MIHDSLNPSIQDPFPEEEASYRLFDHPINSAINHDTEALVKHMRESPPCKHFHGRPGDAP